MGESTNSALIAFLIYTVAVFSLAILSGRVSKGKEFVGEYFLGSRGLGMWAFALTFAATNASGGTFMGFPALIYSHGWSLAFWIAGFMAVPLLSMGLIGKRLNQVARRSNAVTIPEVMAERFGSSAVGLVATSLLVFFMFFYLLAQFKAGGKILSTLLAGEPLFQASAAMASRLTADLPWVGQASGDYIVCLVLFSAAVIGYVVYGGFRAVVWTDVMQGIVMFAGVVVMLGLAVYQVGGLTSATRKMALMTPPEFAMGTIAFDQPRDLELLLPKGTWVRDNEQVFRLAELAMIAKGQTESASIRLLRITTESEAIAIQSDAVAAGVSVRVSEVRPYRYGANQPGVYLTNPGPSETSSVGFLALGTAFSFFVFWPFGATGQPANMVRLMAFKDSRTLRYSILTVSVYYTVIFFSLLIVFCCGRVLMPGMEIDPDRTMPELAAKLTNNAGVPWLAGFVMAAPFAAVMSSVDSFLLLLSSAIVRDVYQKHIQPEASERRLKWISYAVTVAVGVFAVVMVLNPPTYLQDLIVFASGGLGACFLVPMLLALYWRNMTAAGMIAGMLGGTAMHIGLTLWGYLDIGEMRAYEFLGLNPFIWDLIASAIAAITIAKFSRQDAQRNSLFFD